jgi:hypothetical protein
MNEARPGLRDNTLGYHRAICAAIFGEDSPATKFLDEKIAQSPKGEDETIVCSESQLVGLLMHLHAGSPEVKELPQIV